MIVKELNGLAAASLILRQILDGIIKPDEYIEKIGVAYECLIEQRNYMLGDNPGKVYGYPSTYGKSIIDRGVDRHENDDKKQPGKV